MNIILAITLVLFFIDPVGAVIYLLLYQADLVNVGNQYAILMFIILFSIIRKKFFGKLAGVSI